MIKKIIGELLKNDFTVYAKVYILKLVHESLKWNVYKQYYNGIHAKGLYHLDEWCP